MMTKNDIDRIRLDENALTCVPVDHALIVAINEMSPCIERDMLMRIVQQRGCEELDGACKDGRMTSLMRIYMFG